MIFHPSVNFECLIKTYLKLEKKAVNDKIYNLKKLWIKF